jgi:alkylation response protein AidB-like acyl-CoA dehydrogenase
MRDASRCSTGCRPNSATTGTGLPESIRARWVRALIDLRVARLLAYRAVSLQDDPSASAAASAARIATTTCHQQVAELLFDVLGPAASEHRGARAPLDTFRA